MQRSYISFLTIPFQFINDCNVNGIVSYPGYFLDNDIPDLNSNFSISKSIMASCFMNLVKWAENVNLHWLVLDFVDNHMPSSNAAMDAITFATFLAITSIDMADDEIVDFLIELADWLWEDVGPVRGGKDLIKSGLTYTTFYYSPNLLFGSLEISQLWLVISKN